jgi:hypothetical protein
MNTNGCNDEPIPIAQAVATMRIISEYHAKPDPPPQAPRDADLDEALLIVSEAVAGDERVEAALDELIHHLGAHANVTWALARWRDVNTGPVTSSFGVLYARRWTAVMDALRVALEL